MGIRGYRRGVWASGGIGEVYGHQGVWERCVGIRGYRRGVWVSGGMGEVYGHQGV